MIFSASNVNNFELFSGIDSIHTNTMFSLLNTHIQNKKTSNNNIVVIIICTQNRMREVSKLAAEEKKEKMRIVECVYVCVCKFINKLLDAFRVCFNSKMLQSLSIALAHYTL